MRPDLMRKAVAEFVGTAFLVFFGLGSAVFGIDKIGPVGEALAFGLILLSLAYAIGPVSGCHLNPAVTMGALAAGRFTINDAAAYWLAQVLGGIVGAGGLRLMTSEFGKVKDQTGLLGANDWGRSITGGAAFLFEVLIAFVLVLIVLLVTSKQAAFGSAGLSMGLTMSVVYLVAIPVDGASANPARSIGPALWHGGAPLHHVWLFILAPLAGGALAAFAAPWLTRDDERDEVLVTVQRRVHN